MAISPPLLMSSLSVSPALFSFREPLLLSLHLPPWWKPHRTQQQHSCLFYNLLSTNSSVSSCLQIKPLSFSLCLSLSCVHIQKHKIIHPFIICLFVLLPSFSWQSILFVIVNQAFLLPLLTGKMYKNKMMFHIWEIAGNSWWKKTRGPLHQHTHRLVTAGLDTKLNAAQRLQIHFLWRQV